MWKDTLRAFGAPMTDRRPGGADPYGGRLGRPTRFDPEQGVPLRDGGALSPEDCEFIFYGGAGEGGEYLEGFRRSFRKAGIRRPVVPNRADPMASAEGRNRLTDDVLGVTGTNDLAYAKSLAQTPGMQAAARQSRSLRGEPYNLGGYSNGAAKAAAQAYAVAENGGVVDNLVLLGAPINEDLYDAVRRHPRIRNVITRDLSRYGDPIHAGMSDGDIVAATPRLARQWAEGSGHFSLSGEGPVFDQRRDALAEDLKRSGVR